MPIANGHSALATSHLGAPVIGIVERFHPRALATRSSTPSPVAAALTLIVAARSAMLGLSRLAFSLATNRQIPSALGRLHPQRATPFVLIAIAALVAGALVLSDDLDFLFGIFAFGSMLAFTIAHLSICVLRYRETGPPASIQDAGRDPRAWRGAAAPGRVRRSVVRRGLITVLVLHAGARDVGLAWVALCLVFFVLYRKREGRAVGARVTVPEAVLRARGPRARLRIDPRAAARRRARRRSRPDGGAARLLRQRR